MVEESWRWCLDLYYDARVIYLRQYTCVSTLYCALHSCLHAWAWHRWGLCASHRLSVLTSTVLPFVRSIAASWHALCSSSAGRRSPTRSGQSDRIASVGAPPKRIVVGSRAPALRSPSYSARVFLFSFVSCNAWSLCSAWPSAKLISVSVCVCGSIIFASPGAALAFPSLLLKQGVGRRQCTPEPRNDKMRREPNMCSTMPPPPGSGGTAALKYHGSLILSSIPISPPFFSVDVPSAFFSCVLRANQ